MSKSLLVLAAAALALLGLWRAGRRLARLTGLRYERDAQGWYYAWPDGRGGGPYASPQAARNAALAARDARRV